jgi:hypothetical protein
MGSASSDAKAFELCAKRGAEIAGICSNPFLDQAFRTVEFRIKVTIGDNDTWSYDEDTVLLIRGQEEFHHRDTNTLIRVAEATPNPLARG